VELGEGRLASWDRAACGQLCQALDFDFTCVRELSEQNAALASVVAAELDRAHALIAAHRSSACQKLSESADPALARQLDVELAAVEQTLSLIIRLGREVTAYSESQDTSQAEAQTRRLAELMDTLL